MLTRRVVVASAALGVAAGAFGVVVLAHHTPERIPEATTAASQATPSPAASQPAAPAFPDGVTHPAPIVELSRGGRTVTCAQHVGTFWADPGRGEPATPRSLFDRSTVVVVATATESHGYWQRDDGHLPTQNLTGMDWAPLTATNFSVERTLKGPTQSWVQVVDMGADPHNVTTCPRLAVVANGWPLPVVGQRYVLFLQLDAQRGVTRDIYGPLDYFAVTDGVVHPPMHDVPAATLDQFVAGL